jgi:endonuclease/exonuclease/phosphatase family metal-dependent hydrolase
MKKRNHLIRTIAAMSLCLLLAAPASQAQTLKVMGWNILSFEGVNNIAAFNVQPYVDFIKQENPDIICFNEFETATSRMGVIEKLTEVGRLLGMYPFFGFSYVKGDGYYGNGILSKYPYYNTYSSLIVKPSGTADQRSVEYVDILVPTSEKPEGVVVRIVCTHLDHEGTANNRRDQARDVVAKTLTGSTIPTLLLGDMNQAVNTTTTTTYTAVCDRVCDNTTTYGNSSKLDYFFSYPQGKWTKIDYRVVKSASGLSGGLLLNQLSDHYPYIGTVMLNNN